MSRYRDVLVDTSFISSMTRYDDHYPGDPEITVRMVIQAEVNNRTVPFIVDTGAPWCVIDPKLVQPFLENGTAESSWSVGYVIRGYTYTGRLYRITITLVDQDDAKNNVDIEASVFVPILQPDEKWIHPNFLGLDGFLNRMRFAVDPQENTFYFGRI